VARRSRLSVCLAIVMRNSSKIHCARSISRQRTTPPALKPYAADLAASVRVAPLWKTCSDRRLDLTCAHRRRSDSEGVHLGVFLKVLLRGPTLASAVMGASSRNVILRKPPILGSAKTALLAKDVISNDRFPVFLSLEI
jgi:hypothetical protein